MRAEDLFQNIMHLNCFLETIRPVQILQLKIEAIGLLKFDLYKTNLMAHFVLQYVLAYRIL